MSQVIRRCYSVLIGLSKLRHKLPYETKKLLVEALVFPHINYCCTVWGGCTASQKHRIQKAINFAARVVTGLARRQHVTPALQALGWQRFEGMLEKRDVALIQRLVSLDAPPALAQVVQRRSDVYRDTPDAPTDISWSYLKLRVSERGAVSLTDLCPRGTALAGSAADEKTMYFRCLLFLLVFSVSLLR